MAKNRYVGQEGRCILHPIRHTLLNFGAACLDASGVCTDEDIKKMTEATVWCEAGQDNFRGGGFSSHFTTKAEMPCTMIRLNLVKALGPAVQIAEGWTLNLPDDVSEDDIYRPACWNAFGMDKEGQDYRACATYGPMYK